QDDQCDSTQACDKNGMCVTTDTTHKQLGASCDSNTDCLSGQCVGTTCRLDRHAPCSDDVQCATNLCKESGCSQCNTGMDCRSGECSNGVCKGAILQPCGSPLSCADMKACSGNGFCLLQNDSNCTNDLECISKLCFDKKCKACTS